jgi:hypothetical protein
MNKEKFTTFFPIRGSEVEIDIEIRHLEVGAAIKVRKRLQQLIEQTSSELGITVEESRGCGCNGS